MIICSDSIPDKAIKVFGHFLFSEVFSLVGSVEVFHLRHTLKPSLYSISARILYIP